MLAISAYIRSDHLPVKVRPILQGIPSDMKLARVEPSDALLVYYGQSHAYGMELKLGLPVAVDGSYECTRSDTS